MLLEVIEFFSLCNSANTKLSDMEKQVLNLDKYFTNTGSNISPLESTVHQLEQILMDVLGKGNTLICHIGDKTESSLCIKDTMMQIENRVNSLRASCQLKISEVILLNTSICIALFCLIRDEDNLCVIEMAFITFCCIHAAGIAQ